MGIFSEIDMENKMRKEQEEEQARKHQEEQKILAQQHTKAWTMPDEEEAAPKQEAAPEKPAEKPVEKPVEKAAENTTVDMPKALIEAELDNQMERFGYQLQMSGYSMEQYAKMMGGDVSTMRSAFRPTAEKQAKINVTLTKIIEEEGLQNRADRHRKNADAIVKALGSIGFTTLANADCRASTLTVAIYPEGVDDAKFRSTMYAEGVVCANALASYLGKAFRLGHMGNATVNELIVALSAVERALIACGANVEAGKAVGTFMAELNK